MNILPILAIIISGVALIVSLINLYFSYLRPSKILASAGDLNTHIYEIENSGKNWYIVAIFIPVLFINTGAKASKISKIRLKLTYAEYEDEPEYFKIRGNLDRKKFEANASNFFRWQQESVLSEDEPFFMMPKESKDFFFAFTKRFNHPITSSKVVYELQYKNNTQDQWNTIDSWQGYRGGDDWAELVYNGSSISLSPQSTESEDTDYFSTSVHKKLMYKGHLSRKGYGMGSSFQVKKTSKSGHVVSKSKD